MPPVVDAQPPAPASPRAAVHRQAASLALALVPFGIAFGIECRRAGISTAGAVGFSSLVFTGGTQFAAVSTLASGGGVLAAVTAGLLLALRSLAYGVTMAPDLDGPRTRRLLLAHLMIDESVAVATSQHERRWRRYGYVVTGVSVFVVWNLSTFLGGVALGDTAGLVQDLGLDATVPAAFLALLWPRLRTADARVLAVAGAAIAIALVPVAPAGVPIIAAASAVVLDGRARRAT